MKIVGGREMEDLNVSPGFGLPSQPVSDIDDRAGQSGLSSFANSFNSNSHVVVANPVSLTKKVTASGGHPLETESNLNYEQDHQESPIDLINETTKMKHLSNEDFKTFMEPHGSLSAIGNSEVSSEKF